jgi:hypothetical protein
MVIHYQIRERNYSLFLIQIMAVMSVRLCVAAGTRICCFIKWIGRQFKGISPPPSLFERQCPAYVNIHMLSQLRPGRCVFILTRHGAMFDYSTNRLHLNKRSIYTSRKTNDPQQWLWNCCFCAPWEHWSHDKSIKPLPQGRAGPPDRFHYCGNLL